MGLSASQGKFLMLTARKSDLELEAQQVSYKRTRLAASMQDIESEYSEKMNNKTLKFKNNSTDQYLSFTYNEFKNNELFKGKTLTNENGLIIVGSENDIPKDADKSKYLVDETLVSDGARFEDALTNGIYFITEKNEKGEDEKKDISAISGIIEDYDTSDDSAAQAKYDTEMKQAQRKDKQLELEMNRIETNHKAIETELESVQKVIGQNIENSFKTFS